MAAKEIDLKGKTALVTGGSRGIGKAIVELLLEQGMTVWATGRSIENLQTSRDDFSQYSEFLHLEVCNNEKPDEIERLFEKIHSRSKSLFLLVNNAGIGNFGPSDKVRLQDWDTVMDVNARGAFLFARDAVSWMKNTGTGRIINISSVVGLKGYVQQAVYTASKHAVMGFTKVLAREGQQWGIRVSAVCPGGVATDMAKKARPDLDASVLIQPDDVARAVLYLAREPETCITDMIQLRRSGSLPFS